MMFGGINMPENILFNDFWIFDFSRVEFEPLMEDQEGCISHQITTSGSIPSQRKGHNTVCYKNNFYLFGGQTQDLKENTTRFIHILNLETFVWTLFDVVNSNISPRSQMTTNWINPETIFFFGGLENISNEGLNDVICLRMEDLHFSFPFVAGEYPLPRYGHASCNYFGQSE